MKTQSIATLVVASAVAGYAIRDLEANKADDDDTLSLQVAIARMAHLDMAANAIGDLRTTVDSLREENRRTKFELDHFVEANIYLNQVVDDLQHGYPVEVVSVGATIDLRNSP